MHIRPRQQKRRGLVAIVVAISLIAVVGIVAIVVDGGLMLDNRRKVQAAADAAALAAAVDVNGNGSAATNAAKSTSAANGFTHDGTTTTVTVNIPPLSGNFLNQTGCVEVIITYNQSRGFSSVFGASKLPVTARAVARTKAADCAILLLDPNLTVQGQLVCNINCKNDSAIYANSDSTIKNGEFGGYGYAGGVYLENTCKLTCGGINVVGFVSQESGSSLTFTGGGGIKTGVGPWPDPLASVPEPTLPAGKGVDVNVKVNTTISPGLYGKIANSAGTLTMNPGIYYVTNGMQIGGTLVGNGVMIYNTSGDSIDFGNADSVTLTPPTSGTYQGISIFEPRAETHEIHLKSDNNVTITGTLYAQQGEFDIRPQKVTTVFTMGSYVCAQAEWGQGKLPLGTINFYPSVAVSGTRPMLVE